ncbi:MAG: SRPBCC family protein [Litorilinea sp.]
MTTNQSMTVTTPSDREIIIERVFDAPAAAVYKAMIDPELVPLWWGPRNVITIVDKMDVVPGGAWRYIHRSPDGSETAFRGVYREITPPTRLVFTFEWEGMPGHILVETVILHEHDGKTTVTDTSLFHTTEERDGMLNSGMEGGARESWDRLEALLVTA